MDLRPPEGTQAWDIYLNGQFLPSSAQNIECTSAKTLRQKEEEASMPLLFPSIFAQRPKDSLPRFSRLALTVKCCSYANSRLDFIRSVLSDRNKFVSHTRTYNNNNKNKSKQRWSHTDANMHFLQFCLSFSYKHVQTYSLLFDIVGWKRRKHQSVSFPVWPVL